MKDERRPKAPPSDRPGSTPSVPGQADITSDLASEVRAIVAAGLSWSRRTDVDSHGRVAGYRRLFDALAEALDKWSS